MADKNWQRIIDFTLQQEGGYVDNPKDPGGSTNHGITIHTLSLWLGHAATIQQVKDLTQHDAISIYQSEYWPSVYGAELPSGVDLMLFDMGVTSGPRTARLQCQLTLGVKTDGIFGPITWNAMKAAYGKDPGELIAAIGKTQESFYRRLADFRFFGHGWLDRLDAREKLAHELVSA